MSLATEADIETRLTARFGQRPSNIYPAPVNGIPGSQLSCRHVLLNLVSEPSYIGAGEWQVFAITQQGVQVWHIFEPTLEIIPAAHNTSYC